MDLIVHTEGFQLNAELRDAVEDKIGRMEHFAPRAIRARVTLRRVSPRASPRQFNVHVLMEVPGRDVAAHQYGADPLATLDLLVEKLENQLRRRKTARLARRVRDTRRRR